jgi:hypothetical protein
MSLIKQLKTFVWDQKAKYNWHKWEIGENLAFPRRVFLEITNECQMKCLNCPHSRMKRPVGYMNPKLVEKIGKEGAGYGSVRFHLYKDGEALLHPELGTMVGMLRKARKDNYIYLSTNGLAIDDAKIDMFFQHDVDVVRFICHAASEKKYDEVTQTHGNYPILQEKIQLLIDRKARAGRKLPEVRLQLVESPQAGTEVPQFLEYWNQRPVKPRSKRFITWNPSKVQRPGRYPCKDLVDKAPITWDGKVLVSSLDLEAEAVFGNVYERPLAEIWSGDKARQYRLAHLRNQYENLPVCETCNEWALIPNLYWPNRIAPWKKEKWL